MGLNNNEHKNITTMALDRVISIRQASVQYIRNTVVENFDDYFYDVVGVSVPSDRLPEKILLRFSKHMFPYVKTKPIHGSQKIINETEHIISLYVIPNHELEAVLLSYGDDIEVLEPQSLRGVIAEKIGHTYKKYFSVQKGCTVSDYLCSVEKMPDCSDSGVGNIDK